MDIDEAQNHVLRETRIDLDLWLEEWKALAANCEDVYKSTEDLTLSLLSLRIQHSWALINAHLKALKNTGVENIAIMTPTQRNIMTMAKEEATRHLHLIVEATSLPSTPGDSPGGNSNSAYARQQCLSLWV